MPAYARSHIVPPDEVGVYHCIARCVRRAFLCGVDPLTKHDYDHRKEWIRERLEQLAPVFAIDICGYAVMSNHLHVILRSRPDLVRDWSDDEVAFRWTRLCPPRDPATGDKTEPSACDLNIIVSDPARLAVIRQRLSSLSWFMGRLSEPIARRANREDECKGRFWEGRFKSLALLDEGAILACSIYVDLNPIRAGVAETPDQSQYTSAYDRIRSMASVSPPATERCQASSVQLSTVGSIDPISSGDSLRPDASLCKLALQEGSGLSQAGSVEFSTVESIGPIPAADPPRPDSWLCELTLQEGPSEIAGASSTSEPAAGVPGTMYAESAATAGASRTGPRPASRASNQGYLPIQLDKYLSLLDWTGRQLRAASRGTIPPQLAPILERLGVIGDGWVETVRLFGRWFKTAAGRPDALAALAARRGKAWLQGSGAAALAFR
jgi:REP element-mobilizing transposase RayT